MEEKILAAILTAEESGYSYFGIRSDDEVYNIGDFLPESHVWEDREPTEELLPGTCATGINSASLWDYDDAIAAISAALEIQESYYRWYKHQYVIAGSSMEYGEDEGEYILSNARVIAVIK